MKPAKTEQGNHPAPGASPLREMLAIALPVAAVMVSYSISQFVDSVMVARLPNGDAAVAALGNGGIVAFIPISIAMGVVQAINTYVSQHIGAGSEHRASAYPWNGVWFSVAVWLAFFVPLAFVLPGVMPWFTGALAAAAPSGGAGPDPEVVRMQQEYARVLLLGAVFTLCSRSMAQFFFGTQRGAIVLVASLAANAVNFCGNWLLIYGNWGFPALGVTGSAVSTVIGQLVEFLIPLSMFLSPRFHARYGTRSAWRPSRARIAEIIKVGAPQGLAFGNEMICWAIFMAGMLGGISVADNAAGWIGLRYMHLSFLPAIGVSIAISAVVGRSIGADDPDTAQRRASLGTRIAMVYMGLCAAAFVVFREPLVRVFIDKTWGEERVGPVVEVGKQVMICAAVFQVFDAIGISMQGALRGAGDTRWPGLMQVALAWVVLMGGGYAALRLFPEWRSLGPWAMASAYITIFAVVMYWRFASGRWRAIRLIDRTSAPH